MPLDPSKECSVSRYRFLVSQFIATYVWASSPDENVLETNRENIQTFVTTGHDLGLVQARLIVVRGFLLYR